MAFNFEEKRKEYDWSARILRAKACSARLKAFDRIQV
jgi:hypothetical protein